DNCESNADCHEGLECSNRKCLISFNSDETCSTGWDCVPGVWCRTHGSEPGKCDEDHRCPSDGVCTNPGTECDEDNICGYKEGEPCYGPCRKGLSCRQGTCLQ
uniref:Turripeptide OL55-like n=1 Tax=Lophiotoma acuta TaxID=439593 RepID=TU55_LOPAC|nr:RecName: Full=Turripeptide OL55-like [Lophiotoma acuta]